MRKIVCTVFGFWLCGLLAASGALTLPMADGTTLTGDIVSFNENGLQLRTPDDKYTDRLPWLKFSQDGLMQLYGEHAEPENQAVCGAVHPAAAAAAEHPPKPAVKINEVSRLEPPAPAVAFWRAVFLAGQLCSRCC